MVVPQATAATRPFAAGRASVVVRCADEATRSLVEELFADLATATGGEAVEYELQGAPGVRTVVVDGAASGPLEDDWALARLVTAMSRSALDADPGRLHLHAAALALDGRGVVVSAGSGTGKSTLAGALARAGWAYVSDEALAVEAGAELVEGFAKPLMLKPGGGAVLADLAAHRVAGPGEDAHWLVPVGRFGTTTATVRPAVVVILRRGPHGTDGPPVVSPMHPADAVVALMQQTLDAERYGPRALEALAALAARSRCVELTVGRLDEMVAQLAALAAAPPDPATMQLLEAHHGAVARWRVPEAVVAAQVADRVVVHHSAGGAVVALNGSGSEVWRALCGRPPGWWDPASADSPGVRDFLAQLADHGLVEAH